MYFIIIEYYSLFWNQDSSKITRESLNYFQIIFALKIKNNDLAFIFKLKQSVVHNYFLSGFKVLPQFLIGLAKDQQFIFIG